MVVDLDVLAYHRFAGDLPLETVDIREEAAEDRVDQRAGMVQ